VLYQFGGGPSLNVIKKKRYVFFGNHRADGENWGSRKKRKDGAAMYLRSTKKNAEKSSDRSLRVQATAWMRVTRKREGTSRRRERS